MSKPRDAIELLISAIGEADTAKLVSDLRGTRWHVPRHLPDDHPWIAVIGREQADKLAAAACGETGLRIPSDMRVLDALIAEKRAEGFTINELCVMFRREYTSIQKALARQRGRLGEAEQGDLFR